jgi:hypothetical protein
MYLGDTSTSSYGYPWERSRYCSYSNAVCLITGSGNAYYGRYNDSFGLAPAFVIGN